MNWFKNIQIDGNVIAGVLRTAIPAAVAFAVGKGWVLSSSAGDISAALLVLVSALWSVKSNQPPASTSTPT